jgi:hypothetical protein
MLGMINRTGSCGFRIQSGVPLFRPLGLLKPQARRPHPILVTETTRSNQDGHYMPRMPNWEPVHTKSWPDILVDRPGRPVGSLPVSLHYISIRIRLLARSRQRECCLLWDSSCKSLPFPRSVLGTCRLSPGKEDWLQSGIPTLDHSYTAKQQPFGIPVAHRLIRSLAESNPG